MSAFCLLQEAAAQQEMGQEAAAICAALSRALDQWELRRLLGGPYDERDAVLTIQVGNTKLELLLAASTAAGQQQRPAVRPPSTGHAGAEGPHTAPKSLDPGQRAGGGGGALAPGTGWRHPHLVSACCPRSGRCGRTRALAAPTL